MKIKAEYFNMAIQELKNYKATKRHIEFLETTLAEIEEYKSRDIKSIKTDGIRVCSATGDMIGAKLAKTEDMYDSILLELNTEKKAICLLSESIKLLTKDEWDVIKLRYWDNMQPPRIARHLSCDRSVVFRRRNKAISKIAIAIYGNKALEKEEKCN